MDFMKPTTENTEDRIGPVIIAGCISTALLVLVWRAGCGDSKSEPNRAVAHAPSLPASRPALAAAGEPIVIDEIRVEKASICAGEENLISVRAHTANPDE